MATTFPFPSMMRGLTGASNAPSAFSPRKAHDEVVSEGVDNKRGRINPGRSPTPIGNVGAQSLALQFCLGLGRNSTQSQMPAGIFTG